MRDPSGQPTTSTDRGTPLTASKTAGIQRATTTRLLPRPGDSGTQELVHKYGDRLLAVRYRHDHAAQRRCKTVGLIAEKRPWMPAPMYRPDDPVLVRITFEASDLRRRAKAAGAQWIKDRKLWRIADFIVRPTRGTIVMTPYHNLNGDSNVVSYETTDDSIHVVFRSGTYRNYLYDHSRPGKAMVDRMKGLAAQGHGLNSYITTTVRKSYARKW